MANITKYNVYLSETQTEKINLLSLKTGLEPEEVVNNAVYGYLAIVEPFAKEREPEEGMHEIIFKIPEEAADLIMERFHLDDYDDIDEYAKYILMSHLSQLAEERLK